MRVLLLGAGASKPAGYPLASELISPTEEFVHSERELMLRTYLESLGLMATQCRRN